MHDTAVWDEYAATECCDPGNGCVEYYETVWIMVGDTIVNNLAYKKLYYEVVSYAQDLGWGCFTCGFWSSGFFWQQYLFGFIREDSTKKVFIIANPTVMPPIVCSSTDFSTEKILYDFNLNVGDTVPWKPSNNLVTAIDSVQAPNGEFLRTTRFVYTSDYWTEGLGSNLGLFGSYMDIPFECGCATECAQASDLLPPNSLPCDFPVGITKLQAKSKLQLSPNPFSDFISLTSPFQSSSLLSVMNSQGQIILKKRLQPFEKISFTKNELPTEGLIFFRLISDDGVSQSGIAVHIF